MLQFLQALLGGPQQPVDPTGGVSTQLNPQLLATILGNLGSIGNTQPTGGVQQPTGGLPQQVAPLSPPASQATAQGQEQSALSAEQTAQTAALAGNQPPALGPAGSMGQVILSLISSLLQGPQGPAGGGPTAQLGIPSQAQNTQPGGRLL